jgi:sugar O-acyltransferase (sialic acid O-acetyltransferase NeuD family)
MSNATRGVLVIGTGGHARFVVATLKTINWQIEGLITLDNDYDCEERILNHQIIGLISELPHFFDQGYKTLVLAIGDNLLRSSTYHEWFDFGYLFPTVIHRDACVDSSVVIGDANIVGPKVVLGANVRIGDNNIINSGCVVEHESVVGSHCHLAPGAVICGRTTLGDEVLVGANAAIIDSLTVPNQTVIGAGATVVKSVSAGGKTLVGTPAKEIQL